jgi:hypothetical protein
MLHRYQKGVGVRNTREEGVTLQWTCELQVDRQNILPKCLGFTLRVRLVLAACELAECPAKHTRHIEPGDEYQNERSSCALRREAAGEAAAFPTRQMRKYILCVSMNASAHYGYACAWMYSQMCVCMIVRVSLCTLVSVCSCARLSLTFSLLLLPASLVYQLPR